MFVLHAVGQGSTYFLHDVDGREIACFKPLDEEPHTPNNIKGWPGAVGEPSMRPGILSGTLDHMALSGHMCMYATWR